MSSAFETIVAWLEEPRPTAACRRCGDDDDGPLIDLPIRHHHNVGHGLPADDNRVLRSFRSVPGADELLQFFNRFGELHLFDGVKLPAASLGWPEEAARAGVRVAAPQSWAAVTDETRADWGGWVSEGARLPYGKDDFVAIGRPVGAFNTFHWVVTGPQAGSVYFWPWTMPPEDKADGRLGRSFGEFIDLLTADPAEFLNHWCCGHCRYFDGTSEEQYYPVIFH